MTVHHTALRRPAGRLWLLSALALLALAGCQHTDRLGRTATPWPAAEALFRQDPRWLGADAALSIPLDAERRLWLFGDTFVAREPGQRRAEAAFLHNTIAIQHGDNPRTARLHFYWRHDKHGEPAAFFPNRLGHGYWPGHGLRLADGALLVFLHRVMATPGEGLGFTLDGFALALIDNPDADADDWQVRLYDAPALPFEALPGAAVVADGEHLIALAIRHQGRHAGTLVRYRLADLLRGDTGTPAWWGGDALGWQPAHALPDGPAWLFDDSGSEASLHYDACRQAFVHVASYGFGATTLGLRTATAITGPWSAPRTVYTPPESRQPNAFVYAGKAHPHWITTPPGSLVLSYVANAFDSRELFTPAGEAGLYWPRLLQLPPPQPCRPRP